MVIVWLQIEEKWMKIRFIFLLIVLTFISGFFMTYDFIGQNETVELDMAKYNDKFQKVSYALDRLEYMKQDSTELNKIENKYKCHVYTVDDEYYKMNVNNALERQEVIFDYYRNGEYAAKVVFTGQSELLKNVYISLKRKVSIIFIVLGILIIFIVFIIYYSYIRPFNKLQEFAKQIAKGNLDMPLKMNKNNYFGAFTESFDIMREELARARKGEYEANKSKKELVAELSHDIKTPVATIKAMCEIIPLQTNDETVLQKIEVIGRKADVIDALITDMFHATLEDLKMLKVNPCEEMSTIILPMINQMDYFGRIHIHGECPQCLIYADKLRLNQVIDNIINNSYKYADTDIDVYFSSISENDKENIMLTIRDHGKGVPEEDMPLITEKFYRGSNSGGFDGSGLGLYLSQIFMQQMEGGFNYYNDDGFVVEIVIKKVS